MSIFTIFKNTAQQTEGDVTHVQATGGEGGAHHKALAIACRPPYIFHLQ
jgi:hypothetical protein